MKKHMNPTLYRFTLISLVAALYTAISLAVAPLSFGAVQLRFAEVLTVLPVLFSWSVSALTLGCFLSNLAGILMGVNTLGVIDLLFGTAATFLSAVLSYRLRRIRYKNYPVLSVLSPVVCNAIIIGLELTLVLFEGDFSVLPICMLQVGAGEFIACVCLGLPLYCQFEKNGITEDML